MNNETNGTIYTASNKAAVSAVRSAEKAKGKARAMILRSIVVAILDGGKDANVADIADTFRTDLFEELARQHKLPAMVAKVRGKGERRNPDVPLWGTVNPYISDSLNIVGFHGADAADVLAAAGLTVGKDGISEVEPAGSIKDLLAAARDKGDATTADAPADAGTAAEEAAETVANIVKGKADAQSIETLAATARAALTALAERGAVSELEALENALSIAIGKARTAARDIAAKLAADAAAEEAADTEEADATEEETEEADATA